MGFLSKITREIKRPLGLIKKVEREVARPVNKAFAEVQRLGAKTGIKPLEEFGRFSGQVSRLGQTVPREIKRAGESFSSELDRTGSKIGRESGRLLRDVTIPFEQLGHALYPDQDLGPAPSPIPSTIKPGTQFSALGLLEARRKRGRAGSVRTSGRGLLTPPNVSNRSLLDKLG